jgi:hypothetical protein
LFFRIKRLWECLKIDIVNPERQQQREYVEKIKSRMPTTTVDNIKVHTNEMLYLHTYADE